MMHKGLYKYRKAVNHRWTKKILPAFCAITGIMIIALLGYKFLAGGLNADGDIVLRSAAPEAVIETANKYSAKIEAETFDGYARKGQTDVIMMKFGINVLQATDMISSAGTYPKIKKISFSVGGYSDTADLTSLQLYLDKKLISQTPVASGKAVFDDLAVQFNDGEKMDFEIKANIGENASAGNRVKVFISDAEDIEIYDGELNRYAVTGSFPVTSGYFTIVGTKIM